MIDALTTEVSLTSLTRINEDLFDPIKTEIGGKVVNDTLILKPEVCKKLIGVRGITIKNHKNTVILNLTGKILQKRYAEGLSSETFSHAIYNLNDYGVVTVDEDEFLGTGKVRLIHSTMDIETNEKPIDYINYLKSVTSTLLRTFQVRQYPTGLTIGRTKNSIIPFLRIYAKYEELTTTKDGGQILGYLSNEDMDYFRNVLRFEAQLDSFAEIRRYYDFKDENNLLEILYSNNRPVVNVFNQIIEETGVNRYEVV